VCEASPWSGWKLLYIRVVWCARRQSVRFGVSASSGW
jgi:hypothetical protein